MSREPRPHVINYCCIIVFLSTHTCHPVRDPHEKLMENKGWFLHGLAQNEDVVWKWWWFYQPEIGDDIERQWWENLFPQTKHLAGHLVICSLWREKVDVYIYMCAYIHIHKQWKIAWPAGQGLEEKDGNITTHFALLILAESCKLLFNYFVMELA
jgi:hypothetical protein